MSYQRWQPRNASPRASCRRERNHRDIFLYKQSKGTALNDFNYTPRPILQGYSAYTPRLIAANTAFYSSPQAPAFVLLKYQPIDKRYPALEDAGVLRQLLPTIRLFMNAIYALKRVSETKPNSALFHSIGLV